MKSKLLLISVILSIIIGYTALSSVNNLKDKIKTDNSEKNENPNDKLVDYVRLSSCGYDDGKLGLLMGDTVCYRYFDYLGGNSIEPIPGAKVHYHKYNEDEGCSMSCGYPTVQHGLVSVYPEFYPCYEDNEFVGIAGEVNYDYPETFNGRKTYFSIIIKFRVTKINIFYKGKLYSFNYKQNSDRSVIGHTPRSFTTSLYKLDKLTDNNGDKLVINDISKMVNEGMEMDVEYHFEYEYQFCDRVNFIKDLHYYARQVNCFSLDKFYSF